MRRGGAFSSTLRAEAGGVISALLTVVLAAAPPVDVRSGLEPAASISGEATAAWERLEAIFVHATEKPARTSSSVLRVERTEGLPSTQSGRSRPGLISLRQNTPFTFDAKLVTALRHEVAHQFLFSACPAAREDTLFHEAFALSTSGELGQWEQGPYLSLTNAALQLQQAKSFDTPSARRALARLLSEHPRGRAELPEAIERRLHLCADDARWTAPMQVGELAAHSASSEGDPGAVVVLSRHTGELLFSEGAPHRPRPFGSTLKPFVIAGAMSPPRLAPDASRTEWACGKNLPARMDARLALLRSCNGYFLDWERPRAAFVPRDVRWWRRSLHRPLDRLAPGRLGAFGPALVSLGLSRAPKNVPEAIGLEAALEISPLALAQGYRLLAEARPDVISWLADNSREGTLSELPASKALVGVALKTGTVRDALSRPRYGWIAAVDRDVVVVMVRASKMPRAFADELAGILTRARSLSGQEAISVQTFALLPPNQVEVRCTGRGFVAGSQPQPMGEGFVPLAELTRKGPVLCLGAPLHVRFPAAVMPEGGREYAGSFTHSPLPLARASEGTLKEQRARRGSEFLFRTSRLRYVTGVLASEDASIEGEARAALARVVDHNARHGHLRHPSRAICDTTHCQVFQGTVRRNPADEETLSRAALPWREWLTFSRGGEEPWEQVRTVAEVEALFGAGSARTLRFKELKVQLVQTQENDGRFEELVTLPCERLRGPLKLPSCPLQSEVDGTRVLFRGKGEGHGEGLDVEWARASGLKQDALLRAAYGEPH